MRGCTTQERHYTGAVENYRKPIRRATGNMKVSFVLVGPTVHVRFQSFIYVRVTEWAVYWEIAANSAFDVFS